MLFLDQATKYFDVICSLRFFVFVPISVLVITRILTYLIHSFMYFVLHRRLYVLEAITTNILDAFLSHLNAFHLYQILIKHCRFFS